MTQGERIRCLRKELKLSQEAFGNKLGVVKSSISALEKNKRNPTEQMTKSICREFNVNYFWLTEGFGEMFSDSPLLDNLADKYDLSDVDKKIIKLFVELDKKDRDKFTKKLKEIFED